MEALRDPGNLRRNRAIEGFSAARFSTVQIIAWIVGFFGHARRNMLTGALGALLTAQIRGAEAIRAKQDWIRLAGFGSG
jgi:hypothetical protein